LIISVSVKPLAATLSFAEVILAIFMLMVYSFFFNLLISQFCGVYSSLAVDVTGYARLARGEIIVDILKDIFSDFVVV